MAVKKTYGKFKYFVMKWKFRIDQARALFGLITFAALLAVGYKDDIPWFKDQNFWLGEGLLTFIIAICFMLGGYIYDKILQLWSETSTVNQLRNPFTFVPSPKERIRTIGIHAYIIHQLDLITNELGIQNDSEEIMRSLYKYYVGLSTNVSDYNEIGNKMKKVTAQIVRNYVNEKKSLILKKYIDL
ncbi:MAG: hypothetical protein U9O98_09215 [Asgard group archaeon]|nr:hypothetical protein [Asgard group archaeon]